MASGSSGGGGGGRRGGGMLSGAMLRRRQNAMGGEEMSVRDYYQDLRRMGASRDEARRYSIEYMRNTTLR